MKYYVWDEAKNTSLIKKRGISFEEVVFYMQQGGLLDVIAHPNKNRYPNQKIFVIEINNYAYLVPFVETDNEIVLKTIIPSRKATRAYL